MAWNGPWQAGGRSGAMGKYGKSNIWQRMAWVYCSLCGAAGL